ncbi:MAG: PAS domain-containing protein [Smithella sp.]
MPVFLGAATIDEKWDEGMAFILDMTERKLAEEDLRDSRAKLQAAFASIQEAVFMADADGRFTDFNDEFVRVLPFQEQG